MDNDIITRTQKEKRDFLISLMEKDRENQLSEYIWNGINTFYEVYENEMKRE